MIRRVYMERGHKNRMSSSLPVVRYCDGCDSSENKDEGAGDQE